MLGGSLGGLNPPTAEAGGFLTHAAGSRAAAGSGLTPSTSAGTKPALATMTVAEFLSRGRTMPQTSQV